VARMGEETKVYRGLVGKPEGKGPLGRPRQEDGIRMHAFPDDGRSTHVLNVGLL
jgi:hypothetical protein